MSGSDKMSVGFCCNDILAYDARGRWASSGSLAAHAALSNKSAMTTAWPSQGHRHINGIGGGGWLKAGDANCA